MQQPKVRQTTTEIDEYRKSDVVVPKKTGIWVLMADSSFGFVELFVYGQGGGTSIPFYSEEQAIAQAGYLYSQNSGPAEDMSTVNCFLVMVYSTGQIATREIDIEEAKELHNKLPLD